MEAPVGIAGSATSPAAPTSPAAVAPAAWEGVERISASAAAVVPEAAAGGVVASAEAAAEAEPEVEAEGKPPPTTASPTTSPETAPALAALGMHPSVLMGEHGVLAMLAALAALAVLAVVAQRGIPSELSEARALELAAGAESPTAKAKIAAGGTRDAFLDAMRSSVDAAREARQGAGSTSVRVAEGRDQLEQMPSDERAADTAAAAQALQNYLAQEAGQPQSEEQPRMGARKHFKWDNMADKAARVASVLRQERRVKPSPAVRDEDSRMETFLATKKAAPRSQAFTIGVDRRGRLDKQGIRAFLESNGNPQKAQKALATAKSHMGDEEVTWGDDDVTLSAATKHTKDLGIRNLLKGMTGSAGW